jgi:hypothetical protein
VHTPEKNNHIMFGRWKRLIGLKIWREIIKIRAELMK